MLIAALIFLQVIIFVVLITVFRKIMNKNVVLATKHMEGLSQDFSEKEKQINNKIQEAEQKAREIILHAQEEVEKIKKENTNDIEKEWNKVLKEAREQGEDIIRQADKSRQFLLSEIDQRIAKEAVVKACELIQHALPQQFKQDVHAHWVAELISAGFSQLEHLRIPEDVKQVKIVSAFPLTEDQRQVLFKKLADILGSDIKLKEENDPKLVAGLSIGIGELILDGSLKNKIQAGAKNI